MQTSSIPKNEQSPPWFVRLLPSFSDLAFLVPILFLFVHLNGAKRMLGDGDTGWHIRTGEWILAHHSVPRVDLFSFSKPGQPWFAWEWVWDVCFAVIHGYSGLTGVVFVNIALLGLVFVLLYRLVCRQTSNSLVALAVTFLAMAASSLHWLARPHLAAWVLLLIFCLVLDELRKGRKHLFWVLPLLTAVWTNVHGSFFIGIALLIAYAFGDLAEGWLWSSGESRGAKFQRARMLFLNAWVCSLATLLNPYGIDLHRHVITYLLDTRQLDNIGEFQSISFHLHGAIYFEVMLFLALFAICWCAGKRRVADAVIIAAWSHLALMSCRNIPIFALFAAPLVAGMIQDVATRTATNSSASVIRRLAATIRDLGSDFRELERIPRLHLASAGVVLVLALLFTAPNRPGSFVAEYDKHLYPVAALKVLESLGGSRIFADDQWGDYLIYKLYPRYKVFIDGRSDFYGADFDNRLLDLVNAHYDWQSSLSEFAIDTVLVRADAPLVEALKESRRWSVIYDDGLAIVFRAEQEHPGATQARAARQNLSPVSPVGNKGLPAFAAGKPEPFTLASKPLERRIS
jgi:hypothetical protein